MLQRYFDGEHEMLRQLARRFVTREIRPHIDAWEEAGSFPRDLYRKAGALGLLGITYPEAVGGSGGDLFALIAVTEEMMRSTSGGLAAGLGSHHIAVPPILQQGSEALKQRFVPPVLAGEQVAALAITEPGGGSDVANLQTRAVRTGDDFVVNGSKTFITSGCRADWITCAVRTGAAAHDGISLLIIEADTPGYSTSQPLRKMGWWASDTAQLFFDNCRVPAANLIGAENEGFAAILANFQRERLTMAVMANMTAQLAYEECLRYIKERTAFGRKLAGFQVIRHKVVDMATQIEASRAFTYRVAAKINAGLEQITEISMAKNFACQVSDFCTTNAVQIFGGYGYMRESVVERLYRDNRLLSIGGGTTEIMKEIIAKRIL
jgi:acyl-CoA dehydrogenase